MVAHYPLYVCANPSGDVCLRFDCEASLMSLESVLHRIVQHLPVNAHEKDKLEADITAEFGTEDNDAKE